MSGGSAWSHLRLRGASLRLAAHHVRGNPAIRQPAPARACPVPIGRSPLSAGEWSLPGVLRPPGPPGLLTKRGKEGSTQGGGKGMQNGKQVTKKPREKVGVPQKKERSEEGVSAPVCRGTKHYSCTAPRGCTARPRSHLRRGGASLRLAAHHFRGHPAIRQPAPAHACPTPSAGVTLAQGKPHLRSWALYAGGTVTF